MQEVWKQVGGFPFYEVSNMGSVRKTRPTCAHDHFVGKVLKRRTDSFGYLVVHLRSGKGQGKNVPVHRLVARAFLGPPPTDRHEVAHNNGVKADARVSNLRWATRSENLLDRKIHGDYRGPVGSRHHFSKLTDEQVKTMRRLYDQKKVGVAPLAMLLRLKTDTVRDIVKRRSWKHLP